MTTNLLSSSESTNVTVAATVALRNPVLALVRGNAADKPNKVEEIIERQIESASHLPQLEKQANLNKKLKSDNIAEEFKFKRHQKQHELNQTVINKTEEAMETSGEDER